MSKNVELTQEAGRNFGLTDVAVSRVLRRLRDSRSRFAESGLEILGAATHAPI